ncbi:MAG TPA: hypothetical protein VHX37_13465 [Acidobacteriaceae bacterium]|jgi:hypothetical protein|nr:hypothetical protein [Acidobacteriaceae bacterium]
MFGSEQGTGRSTELRVGLRRGWFRYVNFALGSVGTVAIGIEGLRLLESDPNQAFALLRAWGPNFFIGLVIVLIVGSLLNQLMEISRDGVQAQRQMAEAMTQIAAKDDRQAEEVRRLTVYASRELGVIAERMDKQDEVMRQVAASVEGLHARLNERRKS